MWRALIGLLLAFDVRAAEPVVLSAEHIVLDEGRVEATGDVVLTLGDRVIEADVLRVVDGELLLEGADATQAGVRVEAASARGSAEGLTLDALRVDPCACCATAPWSLTAREAVLTPETLRFRGGRLLIAEHAVLPVPRGRVPLQPPRVAPGLPMVGRGPDGFQVAMPVLLRPGPATEITLTPELRVARGPRLSAELAHADEGWAVDLGASLAQDWIRSTARGAVGGQAWATAGPVRAGVSGTLVSDADWFRDYGAALLDRQVPWTRQRAYLAAGPLRLEWLGWQLDAPSVAQVPSLALVDPGRRLGPVRTDSALRLDWIDGAPVGTVGESAALRLSPGPTRLTLGAEGRAVLGGQTLAVEGAGEAEALLLLWARHGPRVHQLGFGAAGRLSTGSGAPSPLSVADPLGLAWQGLAPGTMPGVGALAPGASLGPAVESRWTGPLGAAQLRVSAPWSPTLGPGAAASLRLGAGAWQAEGSGAWRTDAWSAGAHLERDTERLGVALGYVGMRGPARVDQVRGELALHLDRGERVWTPSAGAVASPSGVQAWETGVGWEAGCGCAAAGLRLGFAQDREGPQISAALTLRPGGSAQELRQLPVGLEGAGE